MTLEYRQNIYPSTPVLGLPYLMEGQSGSWETIAEQLRMLDLAAGGANMVISNLTYYTGTFGSVAVQPGYVVIWDLVTTPSSGPLYGTRRTIRQGELAVCLSGTLASSAAWRLWTPPNGLTLYAPTRNGSAYSRMWTKSGNDWIETHSLS